MVQINGDTPVLRHSGFVDLQVRKDFVACNDLLMEVLRIFDDFLQHAIYAVPESDDILERLDMDIGRTDRYGSGNHQVADLLGIIPSDDFVFELFNDGIHGWKLLV